MENLLEIRNVSKKYAKFTLNDISFSIPKGSIVGFIGRNGAGKSTTLKGIMNLVHFDSGLVIAFDKSMKENELYAKQEIGFSLSEVNYYPNKTIKQIVDVIKKFYVNFKQEKFDKLCNLFNLDVNKKLEQLSSGMKVKYNLAFDNVCDLSDEMNEARKIIDKIDCVIRERVDDENDTGDEFI